MCPIKGTFNFRWQIVANSLWWRHNDHDSVSNHQPHECLFNRLFRPRSKKTSKLRVTGLVWGIHRDRWIPRTKASYAENVSIWWRHHVIVITSVCIRLRLHDKLHLTYWVSLNCVDGIEERFEENLVSLMIWWCFVLFRFSYNDGYVWARGKKLP